MKKLLYTLAALVLLASLAVPQRVAAQPDSCIVTGTIYKSWLVPAAGEILTAKRIMIPGFLSALTKKDYTSNAQGVITMKFPRGSEVWVYGANVATFDSLPWGRKLTIPNAPTATVAECSGEPSMSIVTAFQTLYSGAPGVPLLTDSLFFSGSAVSLSRSGRKLTVNVTGGTTAYGDSIWQAREAARIADSVADYTVGEVSGAISQIGNHLSDFNNPHQVTASQVGAISVESDPYWQGDKSAYLQIAIATDSLNSRSRVVTDSLSKRYKALCDSLATLLSNTDRGISSTARMFVADDSVALNASTVTLDASLGNSFRGTLSASGTLTINNMADGQIVTLRIWQSAAFTLAFTAVSWPGGTAPTITATTGKHDIVTFIKTSGRIYGSIVQNF